MNREQLVEAALKDHWDAWSVDKSDGPREANELMTGAVIDVVQPLIVDAVGTELIEQAGAMQATHDKAFCDGVRWAASHLLSGEAL